LCLSLILAAMVSSNVFGVFALLVVMAAAKCPHYDIGNPAHGREVHVSPSDKQVYYKYLQSLDVKKLYDSIVKVMTTSQTCWPADGPQDNDVASYAGLFGRLAWHCAGTLRIDGAKSYGGCEGGRIRHWPEKEWPDNGNLDQARAILAEVKHMPDYHSLSWGDLITFAGTVGIKASGGPANKFCFGRIDDSDGKKSIMLGSEGTAQCELGNECVTHHACKTNFRWPEQDVSDDARCNLTQADGRRQGSHRVGLIYVYPHGPQLRQDHPAYNATQKHQRSRSLSALEVRDTFKLRMGWTDQETVALIGGGHTLGRCHGNCARKTAGTTCNGKFTTTAGYEGYWTRTPYKWNYDYFAGMQGGHEWVATKSPEGNDQWGIKDNRGKFGTTMRLTADLALIADPVYKHWVDKYHQDTKLFDSDFAKAWFKLMHRSESHPGDNDLEVAAGKCTNFEFVGVNGTTQTASVASTVCKPASLVAFFLSYTILVG